MANTIRIGVALDGFKELQALLSILPERTQKNVIGVALKSATVPILTVARRLASKRTGALRRSLTSVIRQYKGKTLAIIGPDKHYYEGGVRVKGRKGKDRPANYAHLIEFGHLSRNGAANASAKKMVAHTKAERLAANAAGRALPAAGRRTVDFVPARPFLRPAVQQGRDVAARAFAEGVAKGLVRETNKLNRKIIKARGMAA